MFSDFSLSAVHDGDQNACSATDQYIMAATSSASTGSTSNNPWIFSTCSVKEMNARLNIIVSVIIIIIFKKSLKIPKG